VYINELSKHIDNLAGNFLYLWRAYESMQKGILPPKFRFVFLQNEFSPPKIETSATTKQIFSPENWKWGHLSHVFYLENLKMCWLSKFAGPQISGYPIYKQNFAPKISFCDKQLGIFPRIKATGLSMNKSHVIYFAWYDLKYILFWNSRFIKPAYFPCIFLFFLWGVKKACLGKP